MSIRVRQLLSALNAVERGEIKKLLPKGIQKPPPEPDGVRYPAALLSALPKDACYSLLGFIAEFLLRLPPIAITEDALISTVRSG